MAKGNPLIAEELVSIPLDTLLGSFLSALVESQKGSAEATADFIHDVGYDDEGNLKTADFKYNKQIKTENGTQRSYGNVEVPFLTLVPVPFVCIEEAKFHLDFKITDTIVQSTYDTKEASTGGKYGFGANNVHFNAKVVSTQKYKDTTYKESNLNIDVKAVQGKTPQGLAILLDILSESIPVQVESDNSNSDNSNSDNSDSSSSSDSSNDE